MSWFTLVKDGLGIMLRRPQMLTIGTPAPDFTATVHDGSTIRLSELQGKKVVLWFYPKANTGG